MVLKDLGVRTVQLLTDEPGDADALAEHGISVVGRIPTNTAGGASRNLAGALPQPVLSREAEGPGLNVHSPSGHDD
jgi:hypothetical protein